MRIGQLARKLDVTPSQIINYLEEIGIEVDKGVNTKLFDAGIEKVEEKFGRIEMVDEVKVPEPRETTEISSEKTVQEENDTTEEVESNMEEVESILEEEVVEIKAESIEQPVAEQEPEESVEVIRPEYVKLQGLKVVDKIELPEPKPKKEEEPATKVVEEKKEEEKETTKKEEESHIITEADIKADMKRHYKERRKSDQRTRKPQRKKRKPLSYEQKLEKERKHAEKQKVEAEKKRKEQKRKAYEERMKKVQSAPAPKKAKKKSS